MLKIIGWILLGLLILLIVLLHFSVTVKIHAGRDGFVMRAKYLFLTLYPRKKKREEDTEPDDAFDVLSDDLTDEQLMQGLTAEQESALLEQAEKPAEKEETKPESRKEDKEDKKEEKKEEIKEDKKPSANKEKKRKSEKEDSEPSDDAAEPSDDDDEDEEKKPSVREKIANMRRKYEKIKPYLPMTWKWFKRLLKAVRIRVDDLWAEVGRDDAHEAAIFYGSIQALVGGTFAELAKWFTFGVKRWNVNCRFAENVIDGGADITIKVRPDTMIWLLIFTGVNFLYIWIKGKLAGKRAAKKAETEAAQAAADTP